MRFGYARVSSEGQYLDAQLDALRAVGCDLIFSEKVSGAVDDRKELCRVMARLRPNDELVVTRLDRLARSTRALLNLSQEICSRGALLRSLQEPWADFTTSHGRLMLAVLAGLAEFERSLIITRTREGRDRARAQGTRFGRKPKLTLHQRDEAARRVRSGETLKAIAKSYNVSHSTISRLRFAT